jgi:hypothetical protein
MSQSYAHLRLRRGTAAEWTASLPQPNGEVLRLGEPGYEKDTGKLKIGDGINGWNDLPYFADGATISIEQIQDDLATSFLVAGTGIVLDYNDGDDTLTISSTGAGGGSGVATSITTINLHNGGVQNAEIFQFTDKNYQSVITGPTPDEGNSAQRIIIQGQNGGTGEGGDVYLWGGDSEYNGGDIKIYAGDADNYSDGYGQGGYINVKAGNGLYDGGDLELEAGSSNTNGGNVDIIGGNGSNPGYVRITTSGTYQWMFNNDGTLDLPSGKTLNFGQNGDTLGPPVSGGGTDRVRLWDFEGGGSNFNYAIGAEGNHVWFAMDVNNGTGGFKFYSRDNEIFKISDDSRLMFPNGTTVAQGTFDNSTGGQSGISLNCVVGYELNWQGGHLKSTADGGVTAANILCDSSIEFPGTGIANLQIDNSSITFSDGTTQTTAYTGVPVNDIIAGSGISVGAESGVYTISAFGVAEASASSLSTECDNMTGNTIAKMTAVYIDGGHGNRPTIQKAIANSEGGSSKTYGITASSITDNHTGNVISFGLLTDVNTNQFSAAEGSVLYLSPTSSGNLTTTKPSAPDHLVSVGKIVRNHSSQGIIAVNIQNGFELHELHNVAISGVTDHDTIVYSSGTSLWENKPGVTSITSGIVGASGIFNILQISQTDYDSIVTKDPFTLYVIV